MIAVNTQRTGPWYSREEGHRERGKGRREREREQTQSSFCFVLFCFFASTGFKLLF